MQAIRDAITLKNQLIVQNKRQIEEARKSTAQHDAKARIQKQETQMADAVDAATKAIPQLTLRYERERLRAIQNLSPELRHAYQAYNLGESCVAFALFFTLFAHLLCSTRLPNPEGGRSL